MQVSLEAALRKFASALTGKRLNELPQELEDIICYAADHYEAAEGGGITAITLETDSEGKITGGKWTDAANKEHDITITVR